MKTLLALPASVRSAAALGAQTVQGAFVGAGGGVRILLTSETTNGSFSMRSISPKTLAASTRNTTGVDRTPPCLMDVYLDGGLVAGFSLGEHGSISLDDLHLSGVEAVEVYRASEAPPEYRNSTSSCGVILIWTHK